MKKQLKILMVEDSEDDALLILNQFKSAGYNIFHERVENGEEMGRALTEKNWDAILSDYTLPRFNGLDALKLFLTFKTDIPFILISGTIGEEIAVEAMKKGAHDYIMKDNLKRLLPAIERELRESKNRIKKKRLEERLKEAEALKRSEEKFQRLVSAVPVGIILQNPKGDILIINDIALNLLDASSDQISGKIPFHPEWNVMCEDGNNFRGFDGLFQSVVANGQPNLDLVLGVFRPQKGNRVWLYVDIIPIFDNKGKLTQVLWTFIDRTERKEAIDALSESEELHRSILLASPDNITITDLQGKILSVSPSALGMFGYEKIAEIVNRPIMEFIDPSDHDIAITRFEQLVSGNDLSPKEYKGLKKDGSIVYIEVNGETIRNKIGHPVKVVLVVRDITQRKKAEMEVSKLNLEKDKFFSIIAHDLRGPFSTFLGMTELMVKSMSDISKDKLLTFVTAMKDSANSLYQLLENLLQWANAQQGLFLFKPVPSIISNLVDESISIAASTAKNKKIHIENKIHEDLKIPVDVHMFQTIIRNLVSNAIKFTPNGGKISIDAIKKPGSTQLSVTDTGIGMDADVMKNLFQLDTRAFRNGTEGEPSTGLGLILCKDFVDKHNGKIWVKSQKGQGTTFYFTIKTV